MKKVVILAVSLIVIAAFSIGWLAWKGYQVKDKGVALLTYKTDYSQGENPKIKIENKSTEKICFSSCYPYYLEKNNGGYKSYQYGNCPQELDQAQDCIEPGQVKAFELLLDEMHTDKGPHRIAIPACVGCVLQEKFRQDKFFYSNEFLIK